MSGRPTTLITRRSLRSRLGRSFAIGSAIAISVAFVVGSFVLADGMRNAFANLFDQIGEDVDLEVQGSVAFGDSMDDSQTPPIPASTLTDVAGIDGVDVAVPVIQRYAQIVDSDGEPVVTQGAPMFGISWTADEELSGVELKDGVAPSGPDQVVIDKATADNHDLIVGDQVDIITDMGRRTYDLVGLVGLGNTDGFAGATLAMFDYVTAVEVLAAGDTIDFVDIRVAEGADVDTVKQAVADVLPPQADVLTGDEVSQKNKDALDVIVNAFGTGLLAFAFITVFVSAFIINNVFAISIGQRLRELALLRAVGANGKQVRRMIYVEALIVSAVSTVVGIGLGVLVAKGMIALFNAQGAGFPDAGTVLLPRTIAIALAVGIGMTMLSVMIPARRASRIPPVAAMRPELGFQTLDSGRFVAATVITVLGAVMFLIGLLVRPGGTVGLIALSAGGGLLLFVGAASLVALVAKPATHVIGMPAAAVSSISGRLGQDNAGRVPRRTAASASALMIGVALVSAAAVFAASLRTSFANTLERSVQADFIITDPSFQGMPPQVGDALRNVPELSAVTPVRFLDMQVDGSTKAVGAADPVALASLINIDLRDGVEMEALADGGLFVSSDAADDLSLAVGDTLDVSYRNGSDATLTVDGIYEENTIVGNYLVNLNTAAQGNQEPVRDLFVVGRKSDDVTPDRARQAIESALAAYPQVDVQSNAEFRESQSAQIDQLLTIITTLLGFAIAIAILGISITLGLSVLERTREIGLLRAVGMNRRGLKATIRWEAIIVSLFGAVIGILLGTAIGVVLSIAVPNEVISTIAVAPTTIGIILIGAVIAGVLAAWSPARRAAKLDVLKAIATE